MGNFENRIVAVYGSLRKGLHNHYILSGSNQIAITKTKPEFRMWSYGGFPGASVGSNQMIVEAYQVKSQEVMDRLDALEGYPSFYNRKIVELENGLKAWIYFIENEDSHIEDAHIEDWKEFISGITD